MVQSPEMFLKRKNNMYFYTPITPTKESIEELMGMIEEKSGKKLTYQEAFEAAYNYLNFFNMLMYLDNKQRLDMKFEYPEDEQLFASILCDGDKKKLKDQFMFQFDFNDPATKRNAFDKLKGIMMTEVLKSKEKRCELKLVSDCNDEKLVLDHMIPLSSNELNKHLRKMSAPSGKKVPSQSFGSNHPSNLILACEACNNFKKHRFIRKIRDGYEIVKFNQDGS